MDFNKFKFHNIFRFLLNFILIINYACILRIEIEINQDVYPIKFIFYHEGRIPFKKYSQKIGDITVEKINHEANSEMLWHIQGKSKSREIKEVIYGQLPVNFLQLTPLSGDPEKLIKGLKYRVCAQGHPNSFGCEMFIYNPTNKKK